MSKIIKNIDTDQMTQAIYVELPVMGENDENNPYDFPVQFDCALYEDPTQTTKNHYEVVRCWVIDWYNGHRIHYTVTKMLNKKEFKKEYERLQAKQEKIARMMFD